MTAHQRAIMGGPPGRTDRLDPSARHARADPCGSRRVLWPQPGAQRGAITACRLWSPRRWMKSRPRPTRAAEQLVQRAGFIQLSDMNGDGRTDYILRYLCNWLRLLVLGARPATGASLPVHTRRLCPQRLSGVQRDPPAMFTCTRGTCELGGNPMRRSVWRHRPRPRHRRPRQRSLYLSLRRSLPARNPNAVGRCRDL